ncbi:unnamed protein product [Closterium sp. NIES-53]
MLLLPSHSYSSPFPPLLIPPPTFLTGGSGTGTQLLVARGKPAIALLHNLVPFPQPIGLWYFGRWYVPVTVFCVAAMSNSVNLTDGLDGLAAGTTAIAFIAMAIACLPIYPVSGRRLLPLSTTRHHSPPLSLPSHSQPLSCPPLPSRPAMGAFGAAMVGPCMGFVAHNRHKAHRSSWEARAPNYHSPPLFTTLHGGHGLLAWLSFAPLPSVLLPYPPIPIIPAMGAFGAAMAGSCMGFLAHNRHKAAVFMGDTGSLALGAALAAMAATTGLFFPLLIVSAVFFLETISVMLQVSFFKLTKRITGTGLRLFRMSPFHHHLELSGMAETTVVMLAYIATFLAGAAAVWVALISRSPSCFPLISASPSPRSSRFRTYRPLRSIVEMGPVRLSALPALLFLVFASAVLVGAEDFLGLPTSKYEHEWAKYRQPDGLLSLDYLKEGGDGDKIRGRKAMENLFEVVFCSALPSKQVLPNNLFQNGEFSDGINPWQGFGWSSVYTVKDTRLNYGVCTNRSEAYSGPMQSVSNLPAASYEMIVWIRLNAGDRQYVNANVNINGENVCIGGAIAKSNCWTKLMGGFTLHDPLDKASIYIQGASPGTEIWIAQASLRKVDKDEWLAQQQASIEKHRMRDVSLTVTGNNGQPVDVVINQIQSDFPFGGNVNGAILYDTNYQKWFKDRFNWAVFNNEGKWYFNEGYRQGEENYTVTDAMTNWFRQRNINVRAHNLFWAVENFVQPWVKYYLAKVWQMTTRGSPVTGIGVESHYSKEPQPARLRHDLNQLAVAGIPIWLTELDFNKVPDDAIRADYFESVMREAFAHPAVHGIVNWSAGRASCDKYKDVDPGMCKPCEACFSDFNYVDNELGKRYVRLRKEWSTHLNAKISPGQPLAFKGFHGTYRARFQVNGQTVEKTFQVPNAQGVAQISIQL